MGPLALMADDAGYAVCGSDLAEGAVYEELELAGIEVQIGKQDGKFLQEKIDEDEVDWFVYTSALPEDHPELKLAREAGIKCTKRDEFTAHLVDELGLKMVAIAGTHGKTTTTAMVAWLAWNMGLPVAHVVGTTLDFAPSGKYEPYDRYFVYEADEYDRNFLKFHPWLAAITCIGYDHPDIYKKERDYKAAFRQFKAQSDAVLESSDGGKLDVGARLFRIAGKARREDARLALGVILEIYKDLIRCGYPMPEPDFDAMINILDHFPGVGRRFEEIRGGMYSDYAHHPDEIAATMQVAKEEKEIWGMKGIVVVYQPHQNTRQHEVKDEYKKAFLGADKIFWLPTYLTREDDKLPVLKPEELIAGLENKEVAEPAELGDELADKLWGYLHEDYLVILMTAGPADEWLRDEFSNRDNLAMPPMMGPMPPMSGADFIGGILGI